MTAHTREQARATEADLKKLDVTAHAACDGSGNLTIYHHEMRKLIGNGIAQLYRASVEILLKREDGKYLTVTNRRWGGFSCPGGKIDPGEHPEDAMMRELKEETGLDVVAFRQVYGGVHFAMPKDPGPPWFCLAYEVKVPDDQEPRQVEEGTEIGWHTASELVQSGLYPDYYRALWTALGVAYAEPLTESEIEGLD